jgi:GAF domain-containing protein
VAAAVRDGQVTSLVAAGMIYGDEPETKVDDSVERMAMLLAEQVATALENRQKRRERMAELAASLEGAN